MNRFLPPLLGLTLSVSAAFAQNALTDTQAYDHLQAERDRARKVVGQSAKPPLDSLKKAEAILLEAVGYYERSEVQELAKKNHYLLTRKGDIQFDLSLIQLSLGEVDRAAESLSYPLGGPYGSVYARYVNEENVFEPLRRHPKLAPILEKERTSDRLFNSTALKTPYRVNISEDEKVAGLSKLWSEAKYNFAYFDHLPGLDWDKLYLEYLPKVRATRSTVEYLHVLENFCAQLHDGHTDVWASDAALADSVGRRPPLRTLLVEGRVLVEDVASDSLQKTGIRPGLEIISIDGMPVREFADRFIRPYKSGSTVQNVDVQTYVYGLLKGPRNQPVRIQFRDAKGQTLTRSLPRSGYSGLKPVPAFRFRILPGNVAYVELTNFENSEALDGFKAAFDSIATTQALILDVRRNGGGDSNYGWDVLGYLTDKPMETGSYTSRSYSPYRRAQGEGIVLEPLKQGTKWPAHAKKRYTNPVVVLTGPRTFSAAEDFAVVFDAMKRGTLVGEPTGGSTGQPLVFSLPGGVMARVCTKRDMYPDGTEWNAKGIQPNVLVRPTVADFQAGRDTVLEAALNHLGLAATAQKGKARKGQR